MWDCKLYAFKHKRTHQTNSPFMFVEWGKCNEITGLDCTTNFSRRVYLNGKNGTLRVGDSVPFPNVSVFSCVRLV